jgi:hypothetical protein
MISWLRGAAERPGYFRSLAALKLIVSVERLVDCHVCWPVGR